MGTKELKESWQKLPGRDGPEQQIPVIEHEGSPYPNDDRQSFDNP